MRPGPFQKIAICGAGLAGLMCAAALVKALPENIEITLIDIDGADASDIFYGTVTSPSSYKFLLDLDLSEPDLLPKSNTSYSLGTHYIDWGNEKRSWTQCYHQPLPIFQGVEFHHYLTRILKTAPELGGLETYIMSVHAARRGVFAHPPQDRKTPLSNVEYGYHFLPNSWRTCLSKHISSSRIQLIQSNIQSVQREKGLIRALDLTNQTLVDADLFIDCLGAGSPLSSIDKTASTHGRELLVAESFTAQTPLKGVSRDLTHKDFGWIAKTPLQDGQHILTICDPTSEPKALKAHAASNASSVSARIGFSETAWINNCLALGHSASILEPLTPAPIHLLQRDIERLIELIPVTSDMSVESREYNRRFIEDYGNASDFHRSFFAAPKKEDKPYLAAAKSDPISPKLKTKITQFLSRGAVVQFDLEPFEKEDWVQQHMGMGRTPKRYDRLAETVSEEQLTQTLRSLQSANETMALKLPSHHDYIKNLLQYLRKQDD